MLFSTFLIQSVKKLVAMYRDKEICLEVSKLIIKLHLERKSLHKIGKIIGSVQTIINWYVNNGNSHSKQRSGRPKILTPREERNIVTAVSSKVDKKHIPMNTKTNESSNSKECSSKFIIYCSDGAQKVWRKANAKHREKT